MDIMTGLAAAAKALEIVKQLREVDKQLNQAEFKLKIAELYSSLADVKMSLADAKEELATKNKLDRYRLRDCGEQTFVYELRRRRSVRKARNTAPVGRVISKAKLDTYNSSFVLRTVDVKRIGTSARCAKIVGHTEYFARLMSTATPSNSFSN